MGELEDSFTQLLGRQPSDRERQNLYRVRDALKLKTTDAVWLLLMVLQHYETLYAAVPSQIAAAAQSATTAVRTAAEAQARAATAGASKALIETVRQAAIRIANDAVRSAVAKWVSAATIIIATGLFLLTWRAFTQGERTGRAVGERMAASECRALAVASTWANTPDGQLAYGFAKVGGLGEVARCSGRGMVVRDRWCVVLSERGKAAARWPIGVRSR